MSYGYPTDVGHSPRTPTCMNGDSRPRVVESSYVFVVHVSATGNRSSSLLSPLCQLHERNSSIRLWTVPYCRQHPSPSCGSKPHRDGTKPLWPPNGELMRPKKPMGIFPLMSAIERNGRKGLSKTTPRFRHPSGGLGGAGHDS